MKQTAVEWLLEQLDGENHLATNEINRVVQQAKAMEKEQIIEAVLSNCYIGGATEEEAEQYYNETFKSE